MKILHFLLLGLTLVYSQPLGRLRDNDQRNINLGPLANLGGTWQGEGFNLISLPNFSNVVPKPFRLLLNRTKETLIFKPTNVVPNRGSFLNLSTSLGQSDINIFGFSYFQHIVDKTTNQDLHLEPGFFLHVPSTIYPLYSSNVVRLATIPHGNSIFAQSTFITEVQSGPNIGEINSFPLGISVNDSFLNPFKNPYLPRGINMEQVKDPNLLLKDAIKDQNIIKTVVFNVNTQPIGQIGNIPFLLPNANVESVNSIFWIETVKKRDNNVFLQLQYSQTVILKFLNISFPHISIATLKKI